MTTTEKIETLKNYLDNNKIDNDNYISAEINSDNNVIYFKFNYMVYTLQIKFITSLNLSYHIITIEKDIYLCFDLKK